MERLQQEMIQETVDEFIANCRECGLPFQKVAILKTAIGTHLILPFIKKCTT
ncbi:MAG: hypothetical protein ACLTDX_02240 [[Clostridium] innocuum]